MIKVVSAIYLLLLIPLSIFPNTSLVDAPISYDSDAPWRIQKTELERFAGAVKEDPKWIGFIIFRFSSEFPAEKANLQIRRSIKYLTRDLPPKKRIGRNRFMAFCFGKVDGRPHVTLTFADKNTLPPDLVFPGNILRSCP